ncbi:MAG: sigma-E factor negative regulatory protein [Burkholderiales bacterium]
MKENLSALIDDELHGEDLGPHLARLKDNAELRRAWGTYHLIGDALRGHLCADFSARVAARLAQEPVVLAPQRRTTVRVAWYVMSAAAGVTAVVLVAWTALPVMRPETQLAANVSAAASASAVEAKPRLAADEVENYLLAHQPYSQSSAMQGPAPYVRIVADERGDPVK